MGNHGALLSAVGDSRRRDPASIEKDPASQGLGCLGFAV